MTSCKQAEVFPIIARLIRTAANEGVSGFIKHEDIASLLLADPVGSTHVVAARKHNTLEDDRRIASRMIEFFSKNITEGTSVRAKDFERERL